MEDRGAICRSAVVVFKHSLSDGIDVILGHTAIEEDNFQDQCRPVSFAALRTQ